MSENITRKVIDNERVQAIITEVGPEVEHIFREMRDDLGGRLPVEMANGIVMGYLRGKGFSWEKCVIGMERFHQTISKFTQPETFNGQISMVAKTDGSAEIKLTPDKV